MKILFTDEVAAKFSWTGQKEKKEKFETLFLWKIIFGKNRFIIYLKSKILFKTSFLFVKVELLILQNIYNFIF